MTAEVLCFPGHQWAHCSDQTCTGCMLCHGGLAICNRCRGGEGALPSDCPGERMTGTQQDEVYAGKLDWRRGEGWVEGASKYSPAAYEVNR